MNSYGRIEFTEALVHNNPMLCVIAAHGLLVAASEFNERAMEKERNRKKEREAEREREGLRLNRIRSRISSGSILSLLQAHRVPPQRPRRGIARLPRLEGPLQAPDSASGARPVQGRAVRSPAQSLRRCLQARWCHGQQGEPPRARASAARAGRGRHRPGRHREVVQVPPSVRRQYRF